LRHRLQGFLLLDHQFQRRQSFPQWRMSKISSNAPNIIKSQLIICPVTVRHISQSDEAKQGTPVMATVLDGYVELSKCGESETSFSV
jgi:hypothetical protein